MANREIEYEQAMISVRYFLDYRTRIFNFCIVVSGAVLTITVSEPSGPPASLMLIALAILVSVASVLAELRAVQLADRYRLAAMELEKELGFTAITKVHEFAMIGGFGLRKAFLLLYLAILAGWVAYLIRSMAGIWIG